MEIGLAAAWVVDSVPLWPLAASWSSVWSETPSRLRAALAQLQILFLLEEAEEEEAEKVIERCRSHWFLQCFGGSKGWECLPRRTDCWKRLEDFFVLVLFGVAVDNVVEVAASRRSVCSTWWMCVIVVVLAPMVVL